MMFLLEDFIRHKTVKWHFSDLKTRGFMWASGSTLSRSVAPLRVFSFCVCPFHCVSMPIVTLTTCEGNHRTSIAPLFLFSTLLERRRAWSSLVVMVVVRLPSTYIGFYTGWWSPAWRAGWSGHLSWRPLCAPTRRKNGTSVQRRSRKTSYVPEQHGRKKHLDFFFLCTVPAIIIKNK